MKIPRKFNYIFVLILTVCVCLVSSTPVFSQSNKENEKKEEKPRLTREAQLAMVEAQRAYEKKDFDTARKALLDYLATNPEEVPADVYLMLGYYWYADGKLKEAMKIFKEGYQKYPDNKDLLSYYAATLYESENFAEAGPMMEKVYETSEKKQLRFLEAAAGAYYQIQDFKDGKRVIRKMIGLTDTPKENWYNMLFQMCLEEEKFDEAEKVLYEALNKFPLNTNYWQQLGMLRQQKEDYSGLVAAYEIKNYIKPPENPDQWKETINIYRSMNLSLRVAKSMEESVKGKNADEEEYIKIAEAYAKAMKIDKAIKFLDGLLKNGPSVALLLKKAEIVYQARRNQDTIKACDEIISVDPKQGKAYYMKGNAAWDLEDWDLMEKAFKKARDFKEYRAYAKNALEYVQSLNEAKSSVEKQD